jgi:hypothetical protein
MEILSLDLATAAGWASKILGRRSGVIEFQLKRGESPGMRFLRCRAWLNELHRLLSGDIEVIAHEQAAPGRGCYGLLCGSHDGGSGICSRARNRQDRLDSPKTVCKAPMDNDDCIELERFSDL